MEGLVLKKEQRKSNSKKIELSFGAFLSKDLFPKKINDKKKEFFYLELATMLEAGMEIKETLDVVINQQKGKEKNIFENLSNTLVRGASFSESLEKSGFFTPYEFYCIKIGEESGKLTEVLFQLAEFYTNRIKLKRQLLSSLSYPLVILSTSVLAVIFMITFVIPIFSDVFMRFGSELPFLTRSLIKISDGVRNNFLWMFTLICGFVFAGFFTWKKKRIKNTRQSIVYRIPLVGELTSGIFLARFCSSMSLLTSAKVPLLQSINLIKKMVDFYPIQIALESIEDDILRGVPLNVSMAKHSIFDSKMLALIKVGEEVNKLDTFFDKLQKRFSDEVEMKTGMINTFLEPMIIVFLGLVIGVILVAMYLPMFKLSTSIN